MSRYFGILCFLLLFHASCKGQPLQLVKDSKPTSCIVIPADPLPIERKSAVALQDGIKRITGAVIPIQTYASSPGTNIYIGHTKKGDAKHPEKMPAEGYWIASDKNDLYLLGGSGHGLMYGVYKLLDAYCGAKKYAQDATVWPPKNSLSVDAVRIEGKPQFEYREIYYPASNDAEFLEWYGLQRFEDLWGLWGHSYDKLVPARNYFKLHPEYYALVKGRRQATQLCLSNADVYKIVVEELKKRMNDNPDALYWSISPNDDVGYCECDKCKSIDNEQGGPQGSLIKFVNKVAANFPDKKITTLAYGYTHRAPKSLKPASNVYIFLSDIDAYRDKPLEIESTAAGFRNDLKAWASLTPNIFVWDYVTQFTSYVAPFPDIHTLKDNINYLKKNGVKGVFVQGSGDTYADFAELKSFLLAHLLNNVNADIEALINDFLKSYYGEKAATHIFQYLKLVEANQIASARKLDIYGNPINEWNTWLSPEKIDAYSTLLDKAEAVAEGNTEQTKRIQRLRLPLEYTVLQQSRFYGIEKYGCWAKNDAGAWAVKPKFADRIARFVTVCNAAGVKELSEAGLSPEKYQQEWNGIFKAGVEKSIAIGCGVSINEAFAPEYPAKGLKTLVDGNPGYADYSYNWLCFYGLPMTATIDLGKSQSITSIKTNFLDDPRHWIFPPASVRFEVSDDGTNYTLVKEIPSNNNAEHFECSRVGYNVTVTGKKVRYVRVTAVNLPALPDWRYKENRKPMLACDEIYVQ